MNDKTLTDLREHLFHTLASLRATDNPMDTTRAKAIAEVAQVVIASAKVEVDYLRAVGATGGSAFLGDGEGRAGIAEKKQGVLGSTVHRMRG